MKEAKIIPFGKNTVEDLETGGTVIALSYHNLIDKSLKELAGLKAGEVIDGIILTDDTIRIKISKTDKINYLTIDYTEYEDCDDICEDDVENIVGVLCDEKYIELDGSLDKHDGKYLSGGLLQDDMPFLLELKQNGHSKYCKCKLSSAFEGEDKHWISYMYYPQDIEEITKEKFDALKEDVQFSEKY